MKLWINGEETEIASETPVTGVLERLSIPDPRGVAIAVDGEVVPRRQWEETRLKEGQRIEVVRAVQGG